MSDPDEPAEQVAALKADNARLRRLLDAADVHEGLRHAFRDTVEMLREILRRSHESSESVEDYAAHVVGRLDALARVRERLDEFGRVDLHGLLSDELMVYRVREGEHASFNGPAVQFRAKAALVLALAVHELTLNAVEHGPLAMPAGSVAISWRATEADGDTVLDLTWKETGAPRPPRASRRGFGTLVLDEMLAYNLAARTEASYEPDGLRFVLRLPLTERVGRLTGRRAAPGSPARII